MAKLATNDYLTNASTFHSLHAIARQVAPVASGGITSIDAPTFALHCLESPTGVKFFVTAKPRCEAGANAFLARVYEAYADYVLKVRERARALLRNLAAAVSTTITTCLARTSSVPFFVPQNPFYETDMPIRVKLFDVALDKALSDVSAA